MKLHHLSLLLIGSLSYAQSTLSFKYDEAGNQKTRELACVNCNTPAAGRIATSNIVEDENSNEIASTQISYFPNPVLEQLQVQWTNDGGNYINSIEVYSMSGQLVISQKDVKGKNSTSLEFGNIAQGIYSIILVYNNGEQKTIKVVKK